MHELNEGEIDLETSWQNFDYNAVGQNGGNDDGYDGDDANDDGGDDDKSNSKPLGKVQLQPNCNPDTKLVVETQNTKY